MSSENDQQKEFWENFARVWVDQQDELDALMAPVLDGVFDRAALTTGQTVLDIGCGTGTSTLRAALAVGDEGHAHGVDISDPMLKRARSAARDTANASFDTADAAVYPFAPGTYDAVISRFGVMFFVDPVKAFANIRKGMKPGARLTMAAWAALDANPWFQVPMYAAKKRLGAPPQVDPDAPGPLAFRNVERVIDILRRAGFDAPAAEAVDLRLTPPGDLPQVARHASSIGPAARTMEHFEGTEADLDAIAADVAEVFAQYQSGSDVLVPAKINYFSAIAR